jgi:hypothetical protein
MSAQQDRIERSRHPRFEDEDCPNGLETSVRYTFGGRRLKWSYRDHPTPTVIAHKIAGQLSE